MCLQIEKNETKTFQFFPLRNNIILKHCVFDTSALICLFFENQNQYLDDIDGNKDIVWNKFFNLKHPIFKQNNYCFDYKISTDCYSVSLQMIHKDCVEEERKKKLNMKNKKNIIKEACKDKTEEEQAKYRKELKLKQKEEENKFKQKIKEEKKKLKEAEQEAFKKLSKDEQQKIKESKKQYAISKKEFPYLEDLNPIQLEELKNNNWVVCDPGKRVLFYMKNKDGVRFRYSNRQYVKETKRLKYQRLLKNYKDKTNISKIENELSKYNSKSCELNKFRKFILNKNKLNEELLEKYLDEKFRKYKWYSFLNRKKTESSIIKRIKNKFGKTAIINYGDWNANGGMQMRNFISTPNLGLKRKIAEQMTVYNLDEFRTSKLNCYTNEVNTNLNYFDKKGKRRTLHAVLMFKTEQGSSGCINRDENSVNNMIEIVNHYIKNKERPLKFRRDYDLETNQLKKPKSDNSRKTPDEPNITKPAKVRLHKKKI